MDSAYLAVRADMVVRAKALFHVRPSMLEAGTKRLLLTAQAIVEGKRDDRWGHHAKPVVAQFCAFTAGNGQPALPWQELVEDQRLYDGKEGVSSRTGNRPLGTTARYQVQASVMVDALSAAETTRQEIASELELPLRFIEALCDGEWPSISQHSLDKLKSRLGELSFAPLTVDVVATPEAPSNLRTATSESRLSARHIGGIAVIVVVLAGAGGWWVQRAPDGAMQDGTEVVGYWDYDAEDGRRVPEGLVLIDAPGGGLGAQWQSRLQLLNHAQLTPRNRQLWPVELHRASRKVCVNYPGYPTYAGYVDFPGERDDGVYLFGPCE